MPNDARTAETGAASIDASKFPLYQPHHSLVDATASQRLGTCLIDIVCLSVLTAVLTIGIEVGLGVVNEWLAVAFADGWALFLVVATVLYYVVLEGTTGRTLGKMVVGTRVVRRRDGGRASLTQLLGRSVARYIPFEPFSVWSSDGMWHDRLSGTRVVVCSPRP